MIQFKITHDRVELDIIEQPNGRFHGYVNEDLYYDILEDEEPYNDEMKAIQAQIKAHRRAEKKASEAALSSKLEEMGEASGKRMHHFYLDNRLYYAIKAKNVKISQFINEAIAEKLEGMK